MNKSMLALIAAMMVPFSALAMEKKDDESLINSDMFKSQVDNKPVLTENNDELSEDASDLGFDEENEDNQIIKDDNKSDDESAKTSGLAFFGNMKNKLPGFAGVRKNAGECFGKVNNMYGYVSAGVVATSITGLVAYKVYKKIRRSKVRRVKKGLLRRLFGR